MRRLIACLGTCCVLCIAGCGDSALKDKVATLDEKVSTLEKENKDLKEKLQQAQKTEAAAKSAFTVEGQLLKDGQPFRSSLGIVIGVSFNGGDKGFPATVSPDGSFVAKDVPPGKYKVTVIIISGSNDPKEIAKLKDLAKQFDAIGEKLEKLEYEVTSSSGQKINVDISKGRVTKQ